MATSGKKGKKKGTTYKLGEFIADSNTGSIQQASQVQKKVIWSNDVDDIDEEYSRKSQVISLPTAPRANRLPNEDSIPNHPPFFAYVANLPYDTNESDVHEFFSGLRIESVKLPREDGESGRSRGFGYIKFETKEDLISAIGMPDPMFRNRRIRIDISSENDQKQMGSGNWRKDGQHGGEGGGNRRGFSFRDREKTQGNDYDNSTSWRSQEGPKDSPPPQRRNNYGGDRERDSGFQRRGYDNRDRDTNRENEERPKLNLTPRTLPKNTLPPPENEVDVVVKPVDAIPSARIFGEAKPVDTSARERQIEERIEKERLDLLAAKTDEVEEEDIKEPVKIENGDGSSWRKTENVDDKYEAKTNASPPMSRKYSPPRDYKDNRNDRRGAGPGGSRRDDNRRGDRDDGRIGERDDRRDFRQNREGGRDYNKDFNRNDRDSRNKDFRDKDNKGRSNVERERYAQKTPQNRVNRNRNDPNPLNKDDKEFNEGRMPKYQPQQGPNLELSNKYNMLEIDDYEDETCGI